jgi:hypothetical protein
MLGFAVQLDKFSLEVQANLLEYDFEHQLPTKTLGVEPS